MSGGIYVALSGAVAQTSKLDATANNLANASTAGYQRVRPVFREALASAAEQENGGLHGVQVAENVLDTSRGEVRVTGNPLDVVLPDNSYLGVQTSNGTRFTRAGSLSMKTDGTLQTSNGVPVVGEGGSPIKANPSGGVVKISENGGVFQADARIGQLQISTFSNPSLLAPEGGNLLAATGGSGAATPSKGQLELGAVEQSNTSVVGAMTDLVTANRTFDAFQRAIDTFHDADQKATQVAGDV